NLRHAGGALAASLWFQIVNSPNPPDLQKANSHFQNLLSGSTSRERSEAALGLMSAYYWIKLNGKQGMLAEVGAVAPRLAAMLTSAEVTEVFAAVWALAWLGACGVWLPPAEPDLLGRLFELGWSRPEPELRRVARWALSTQPLVD